jgi:hypothetical protein
LKAYLLLVALGIASLAPSVPAQYSSSGQNPNAAPSDAAVPAADQTEVSGTIVQVDASVGALMIKTANGEEMKFAVDANTKINFMGTSGKLEDLKPGHEVVVSAKEDKALSIKARVTSIP